MSEVKKGDKVKVNYTGKFENGEVFDSSEGKEPLEFEVGTGQMIPGFDKAILGMKIGEKKTINITPEEGYGQRDENKIIEIDKKGFSEFDKLKEGVRVMSDTGLPGKVIEKNEETAKIDFNHELAGKKIIFDVELVSIE